jgi:hypothetical protein
MGLICPQNKGKTSAQDVLGLRDAAGTMKTVPIKPMVRPQTMDITDRILGAQSLIAVFGYWPSFHDAEVTWIKLDRRPFGEGYGPTLEAMVHAFEITSEVGVDGCYVLRHHVLVHFRFCGVVELQLAEFNHQNVLFGLGISDLHKRQLETVKFGVRFDSSFGVNVSFQCRSVEVIAVVPCSKEASPV